MYKLKFCDRSIMESLILNSLFLLLLVRTVYTVPVTTKTLETKEVHFCDTLEDTTVSDICHKERKPLQKCGTDLANLMRDVCGTQTQLLAPDDSRRWIRKRIKRAIANDCCSQTCSISQIIYQYCADPIKVFKDRQRTGYDDEDKTPYKLKIEQSPIEGRKSLEDKTNGKVRDKIKRKNNKTKRREKCGCRKRKMKWGKIPKSIQNYPPHKRGEVTKNSQPVIFGSLTSVRLIPYARDNTLEKDWSS